MKVYTLERTQVLDIPIEAAWRYFSNPHNLAELTPPYMGFKILSISEQSQGDKTLYSGQVIHYRVCVLPRWPVHWVTEIKAVKEPTSFIDEQRIGPYALWYHQHHFASLDNGATSMRDLVHYALPLGPLGRLAHAIFVKRTLNNVFDYRQKQLGAKKEGSLIRGT